MSSVMDLAGKEESVQQKEERVEESVKTEESKMVMVDGPLSNILTTALNVAYAKPKVGVGHEDASMDTTIIQTLQENVADYHREQMKANSQDLYVYGEDAEGIEGDGLNRAFDSVRVALGMECFSKVIVYMRNGVGVGKRQAIFEEFVVKGGGIVCHDMDLLKRHVMG